MAEGSALSDGKEAASRAATGRTTESGRAARRESPVRVAARRARAPDAWSSGAPSAGRGCHLGRLALKERVRLGPEDSDLDSVSIKGRLIELRRAGPFWHRHSGGHHRGARPCERSWLPDYGSRCRGRGLPSPRAATRRGGWGGGYLNPRWLPVPVCALRLSRQAAAKSLGAQCQLAVRQDHGVHISQLAEGFICCSLDRDDVVWESPRSCPPALASQLVKRRGSAGTTTAR